MNFIDIINNARNVPKYHYLAGSDDRQFPPPSGYIENCINAPCDTCKYYYGEIHTCMYGETDDLPFLEV